MANIINLSLLKSYGPSLPNRDDSGDAKQVVVGGIRRARISSQCLKRAIRAAMGTDSFRTAHLEDCIELMLKKKVEDGTIELNQMDEMGKNICELLDCDWTKRSSLKNEKDKNADKKNDAKGRTVVVTNPMEISSVVNVVIANRGCDSKKVAEQALENVRISVDKAMFGTMVTSGILESVDGAVQMGQTFSIDEYIPESDYITAVFSEAKADEDDPFYGCYQSFAESGKSRAGSETIADSWLYSNTMYSVSSVNMTELRNNLSKNIVKKEIGLSEEDLLTTIKDCIGKYAETFAITEPSAKQNSMSTHSAPAILYIESILDGNCQYADFNRVVRRRDNKEIAELGIERILEFAKDETFRTGIIKRYVMLSAPYKSYEAEFEKNGIVVIHNLTELKEVMGKETERLII